MRGKRNPWPAVVRLNVDGGSMSASMPVPVLLPLLLLIIVLSFAKFKTVTMMKMFRIMTCPSTVWSS